MSLGIGWPASACKLGALKNHSFILYPPYSSITDDEAHDFARQICHISQKEFDGFAVRSLELLFLSVRPLSKRI